MVSLSGWVYRNTHFPAKLRKVIAKCSIAFSTFSKPLPFSGKVIAKCRLSLLSKMMSSDVNLDSDVNSDVTDVKSGYWCNKNATIQFSLHNENRTISDPADSSNLLCKIFIAVKPVSYTLQMTRSLFAWTHLWPIRRDFADLRFNDFYTAVTDFYAHR